MMETLAMELPGQKRFTNERLTRSLLVLLAIFSCLSGPISRYSASFTAIDMPVSASGRLGLPDAPSQSSQSFSPMAMATTSTSVAANREKLALALKPLLVELGVVLLLQAVGLPLLSMLGVLIRRIPIRVFSRNLRWTAKVAARLPLTRVLSRHLRTLSLHSARWWKAFGALYSKASLSKIVNRSKRLIKLYVLRHDEKDEISERH